MPERLEERLPETAAVILRRMRGRMQVTANVPTSSSLVSPLIRRGGRRRSTGSSRKSYALSNRRRKHSHEL